MAFSVKKIVDQRITFIGSVLRDQIIHSNTTIQDNNSDMHQKVQEKAYLRDSHRVRVKKGAKVRVRRVRTMLRISILKVRVRRKAVQARRQRKNGTRITPNTQMMTMDIMKIHQRTKSKNKKLQKTRTMKDPTVTSGVEKKTKKNQNLLTTMSRWSRLSSLRCRDMPKRTRRNNRKGYL